MANKDPHRDAAAAGTLPYDPDDWQRRLDAARIRRAEALKARAAARAEGGEITYPPAFHAAVTQGGSGPTTRTLATALCAARKPGRHAGAGTRSAPPRAGVSTGGAGLSVSTVSGEPAGSAAPREHMASMPAASRPDRPGEGRAGQGAFGRDPAAAMRRFNASGFAARGEQVPRPTSEPKPASSDLQQAVRTRAEVAKAARAGCAATGAVSPSPARGPQPGTANAGAPAASRVAGANGAALTTRPFDAASSSPGARAAARVGKGRTPLALGLLLGAGLALPLGWLLPGNLWPRDQPGASAPPQPAATGAVPSVPWVAVPADRLGKPANLPPEPATIAVPHISPDNGTALHRSRGRVAEMPADLTLPRLPAMPVAAGLPLPSRSQRAGPDGVPSELAAAALPAIAHPEAARAIAATAPAPADAIEARGAVLAGRSGRQTGNAEVPAPSNGPELSGVRATPPGTPAPALRPAATDPATPAASATVHLVVHIPRGAEARAGTAAAAASTEATVSDAWTVTVDFAVSTTHLRYFHRADADAASALADRFDLPLRNFTSYRPRPPRGLVEMWVAGPG